MNTPPIVSPEQWQQERHALLVAEQEVTRAQDALADQRRRLPMVEFGNHYRFDSPTGPTTLLELFGDQPQLVVYQFMDKGPGRFCSGCTAFANNLPADVAGLLAEAGASWVLVSDMPLAQIESYKVEQGWMVPFVSSHGTSFAADCGAGSGFMLSVFLRDGAAIYRTYNTTERGVDRLLFVKASWTWCPTAGRRTGRTRRPAGRSTRPTANQGRPATASSGPASLLARHHRHRGLATVRSPWSASLP